MYIQLKYLSLYNRYDYKYNQAFIEVDNYDEEHVKQQIKKYIAEEENNNEELYKINITDIHDVSFFDYVVKINNIEHTFDKVYTVKYSYKIR